MKKRLLLTCFLVLASMPAKADDKRDAVYARVMKSQTIRCGYFLFPPLAVADPASKKPKGLFIDLFDKIGENLHLKVEWTEEVSFAGLIPGLQTNRYDAVCTPMWPTAARAREVEFVTPLFYTGLGVWVRKDDNRFTNTLDAINDPGVTITGVDGQIEQTVHDEQFPKSKMLSLPGGTDFTEMMMNVATKKADVTFVDFAAGALYESRNPGKLKNIAIKPLRVFPFSIAVLGGETRLKNMLDVAVQEIQNSGAVERKLKEYDPDKNFLLAAPPYVKR